ncbi:hypothetical protein BDP27DRAFT_1340446 [Rhodocollybia butyracea]|uniref:Uncharacterized protein n=1 Tax=Rhodocollybia butyracea TaxID=206335 RepID=A0A9P5P9W4_9AGAR|nr:hypothetical protein BDP27DRAFT_1340446 [Rhodocollybia butyracea]
MASTKEDTALTLLLTPDNPSNTSISDAGNGALFYRVDTEFKSPTSSTALTTVSSAVGKTIASWKWLKKSIIPLDDTATFSDPTNGKDTCSIQRTIKHIQSLLSAQLSGYPTHDLPQRK